MIYPYKGIDPSSCSLVLIVDLLNFYQLFIRKLYILIVETYCAILTINRLSPTRFLYPCSFFV